MNIFLVFVHGRLIYLFKNTDFLRINFSVERPLRLHGLHFPVEDVKDLDVYAWFAYSFVEALRKVVQVVHCFSTPCNVAAQKVVGKLPLLVVILF